MNSVTRHVLDSRRDFAASGDEMLLQRGLDVPDGICISPTRRWLAVSNHNTHSALLDHRVCGRPLEPRFLCAMALM